MIPENEPTLQDFTSLKSAAELEMRQEHPADFALPPELVLKVIDTIERMQAEALTGSKGSGPVTTPELEAVLNSLAISYDALSVARNVLNPTAFPMLVNGVNNLVAVYTMIATRIGIGTVPRTAGPADISKAISAEVVRQSGSPTVANPHRAASGEPPKNEPPLSSVETGISDTKFYQSNNDYGAF